MIGRFRTMRAKPGKADEFAALLAALQRDVRANEPGVLVYQFMRSVADPLLFILTEVFRDEQAQAAHAEAAYHLGMMAQAWACVAEGGVDIQPFAPLTEADIAATHG